MEKEKNTPCNLTADQNGVIVRMITRAGYPKLHVGEECHIGDVLVSGCLELKNDSQEVVRYEGVHADADIYIKRKRLIIGKFLCNTSQRNMMEGNEKAIF